jgi:plasmid stabilization system protein ParE
MADAYHVNITSQALADLQSIFAYIARDSSYNAAGVIKEVLDAIDDLEYMPGRFRIAGKSRKHGRVMHARVVRPFIIYYRIHEPTRAVFVTEIRHGARRQPRRFP